MPFDKRNNLTERKNFMKKVLSVLLCVCMLMSMAVMFASCGTEDELMVLNTGIRDKVRALGADLTWEQGPGNHNWEYWDEMIQHVLNWLPLEAEKK